MGERLAVMTALNLAHELTAARKSPASPNAGNTAEDSFDSSDLKRRILAMEARLDEALLQQVDLF